MPAGAWLACWPKSYSRNSVSRHARKAIADDRLLLISPYHPEARFTVGTAMARNKLIYALADYGLVVSAERQERRHVGRGGRRTQAQSWPPRVRPNDRFGSTREPEASRTWRYDVPTIFARRRPAGHPPRRHWNIRLSKQQNRQNFLYSNRQYQVETNPRR